MCFSFNQDQHCTVAADCSVDDSKNGPDPDGWGNALPLALPLSEYRFDVFSLFAIFRT